MVQTEQNMPALHAHTSSVRQEYCGVRRAAAEKLFTHSGCPPSAEIESDAASDDAAAAEVEAAPAALPVDAGSIGYQAADGKRQRQRLLGELREAVPAAAARMLADPLLDGNVCDPPRGAACHSATNRANAAMQGCTPPHDPPADMTTRTSEQQHERRVAAEVWRTAMGALAQQWTSLPALLAEGAMERLLSAVKGGSADDGERWAAWLAALLELEESATSPQKSGSRKQSPAQGPKRKRTDAAGQAAPEAAQPLWTPTPDQAAALVKQCLTSAAGFEAASAPWQEILSGTVSTLISAARPREDSRLEELAQKACAVSQACNTVINCAAGIG